MRVLSDGSPNYGNALNAYVWPKLITKRFSSVLPEGLFVGIGSLLRAAMPRASHYVVCGAGACYHGVPVVGSNRDTDGIWDIRFVRGPGTAAGMGGVRHISDPALLLRLWHAKQPARYGVSFMPRWNSTSVSDTDLEKDGIHLIRATAPVQQVIEEIARSELLLTETLHGAITADALRVPWIALHVDDVHAPKWLDWCGSMGMVWNRISMRDYTLDWARRCAVPQLSALSTLNRVTEQMLAEIARLNDDIEDRRGIFA